MSGYKYTEKCDVYSFGIVLWEVMSRKPTYSHLSQVSSLELLNRIVEGTRPNPNDLTICENTGPIKDLITQCWHSNPEERPTMRNLLVSFANLLLLA
ncbi:putative mitogen-activated protein kinase kinase kinase 7-like [Drosophila innubila]|uniref:putative mitogen-activated protein kinase kinase kinase 7-like n=1 Tax=Drosophila innubila TaxID=198719 RepID=UPI00148DD457|nr:putative mitogen-activated protein kinase kinase kinase 7-like [Drosophila innubila]